MGPEPSQAGRFAEELDALLPQGARIGVAVSGGPDSLALLLLLAAVRPGEIEAATVDHALRPGSRREAEMVAGICRNAGVPHHILTVEWPAPPASALQERARDARYRLLADWAKARSLQAIATAHHLDDQVETFVMRLARGSGVRGLAAMRRSASLPGSDVPLIRPLLGWRRSELAGVCAAAGVEPVLDPSNEDEQFERVRVRGALRECEWLDPEAIAASAAHLGDADAALDWACRQEWDRNVTSLGSELTYRPGGAPAEIRRRIVSEAVSRLATEGATDPLRGRELQQLIAALGEGRSATLRGVRCEGGVDWRFARAPARRS